MAETADYELTQRGETPPDVLPTVRPRPTLLTASVTRKFSPKQYETVEIGFDVECEIDHNFTLGQNLDRVRQLLTVKVDEAVNTWFAEHPSGR